ncbi:MAG: endonuclease/exonuclease/phosphatase family protein, partial [Bacteroidales bacterium]
FRALYPEAKDKYSWWSYRGGARAKNIGWRIDYFLISEVLKSHLQEAFILPELDGSDHCPVGVELSIG